MTDNTTATTTAVGNTVSAAVQAGPLDVQSNQSMQGSANASTVLNVAVDSGQTTLTTSATGNAGEADSLGGGAMTATIAQDATSPLIRANSQIEASAGEAGDVSTSATALANTQGLGSDGAAVSASVTQTSSATVEADGGAVLQYTPGTASFAALAVSNNITATGANGSDQTITASQSMTGAHTQATHFIAVGNAQIVANAATATANDIAATNEGGALNVIDVQDNQGYVRGQAETTAFEFGSSSASAMGVGNSATAAETGGFVSIDNTQSNSGTGVDVIASSSGTTGFDLQSTATAMGNSVLAFSCSTCGGRVTARNQQSNSADIGASSSISVAGSARSVTGVATAVGNSATFYVSSPGS